jgi:hypothetical protein
VKAIERCALLIFVIGGFGGRALGDGKFFVEKIPPDIPYQRAFILFYEDSEILVLQSKYELSQTTDVNSLGWIVPVPTTPEVASVEAYLAGSFFFNASIRTQPEAFSISIIFFSIAVLFFLGGFAFLLICAVEYPFLGKIGHSKTTWGRQARIGVIVTLVAFFLTIVLGIQPLGGSLGGSNDIEVIKAVEAGIYDVKVVRSQSAEAILGWLIENGFGFNDNDTQTFKDYIDRGWCFVVAKVGPDQETQYHKPVSDGMVAPLILKFETKKAVYPLALTSTIGSGTEVLLYTFSENKLSCDERLVLRYAGNKKPTSFMSDLLSSAEPESSDLSTSIPKDMYLCKFKKKLKPEEMKTDLEFEFAQDNKPYKEKKIVW